MKVSTDSIKKVISETLSKYGVAEETIKILTETMLYADRSGVSTHGIRQLPMYVNKIKAGKLNPGNEITTVEDAEAVTVLDAGGTFGQAAAGHALDIGIEKAKKYGIAVVGIRNSNTFGAAGYFGYHAALQGVCTIIFANAAPAVAPTGGNKPILGTNPLCLSFPGTEKNVPVVLDMATTVVSRSKIRIAAKEGKKIPTDWAVDADGNPTDDPNEALKGSLLPIAGYKGYGLSLFIDFFAGLLTGSAFSGAVKPLTDISHESGNGQFIIFIDTEKFMTNEELTARTDFLCNSVKACGVVGSIMLPGEHRYIKMLRQVTSVDVPDLEVENVNKMTLENNISAKLMEVEE